MELDCPKINIGKNGLTGGIITNLKTCMQTHNAAKLVLLKSAGRDRSEIEKIEEKILAGLGKKFTAHHIGFTILIRKRKKEKSERRRFINAKEEIVLA